MALAGSTRNADLEAIRFRVLSRLLTERLGLAQTETVDDVAAGARWRQIPAGNVIDAEGHALVVISGLAVETNSAGSWDQNVYGTGEIIGAGRALGGIDEGGTMLAARDLMVAGIDRDSLRRLLSVHPELAPRLFRSGSTDAARRKEIGVVALVAGPGIERRVLSSRLQSSLEGSRRVEVVWPERADTLLDFPGASRHERGEVGDLAVRGFIDELVDQVDHVILETDVAPTPWARRCLSMADQIVLMLRSGPDEETTRALLELLDHAPLHTRRLLVVEQPAATSRAPSGTASLVDLLGADHAVHVQKGADLGKVARLATGTGRGLVLSGGGARGFAHLGVYRALHEAGFEIDIFGGASIGSPLAAAMADGIPPEELDEIVARLFAKVLDYTIPLVALVKGRGIARATAEVFGDRHIEDLWHRYFCVSTNLTNSAIHRHERGSVVHAVRASTAIPGVMPPVPHGQELLVDAGVSNNLPVDVMRELTPQGEIVAVDTTPNRGPTAREDYGLSVSGIRVAGHRLRGRRTHPRITSTLLRALIVGSDLHRDRNGTRTEADLYLDLDLKGVPMLAFDSVREVAARGYDIAMPQVDRWLATREAATCGT